MRWSRTSAQIDQIPIDADAIPEHAPERPTPLALQGQASRISNMEADAFSRTQDRPLKSNAVSDQPILHTPEPGKFALRTDIPNIASPQDAASSPQVASVGIEMQSVIDRILETRQNLGNDFGRVKILLDPPHLGYVDLDIIVRGEKVDVVMTADNATAQQALQSRAEDIRMALQRQDLKIEGFQVLLHDNGQSQQQADSGAMHRQGQEQQQRWNTNENVPSSSPVLSYTTGGESAAGLSIFV
jgi:flagellar hook-length control protein FliK